LNVPQRKLFISGLSRIATQAEVDERRAELERAFRKYGSNHGAIAIVPGEKAYAFVELVTERQADLALQEMQGKYRLYHARLSRHGALQEERVAVLEAPAAAASDGQKKDNSDWD
jgi:RNA recognition motif-containing protein